MRKSNSKSTRFECRLPNHLYADLVRVASAYNFKSLSDYVKYVMSGDILKRKRSLDNAN